MRAEEWLREGGQIPDEVVADDLFLSELTRLLDEPLEAASVLDEMERYEEGLMRVGLSPNRLWSVVGRALDDRRRGAEDEYLYEARLTNLLFTAWRAGPSERARLAPMVDGADLGPLLRGLLATQPDRLTAITPAQTLQHLLNDEASLELNEAQWAVVASAAAMLNGGRPSAAAAIHLAALGGSGRLRERPDWNDILHDIGVDDDDLIAEYHALSHGDADVLTQAHTAQRPSDLVEKWREIRAAMEAMGFDGVTLELDERLVSVEVTDPWTQWTRGELLRGADGAQRGFKCLQHCARAVGFELSGPDDTRVADPRIWSREMHLRYWLDGSREQVAPIMKKELLEWGRRASPVGTFRLHLAYCGVLSSDASQRLGNRFGEEQQLSLAAYFRGDRSFFEDDGVTLDAHAVGTLVELGTDGIERFLVDVGLEVDAGITTLADNLVREAEESRGDRVRAATTEGDWWLLGLVQYLEHEHQVMFLRDPRPTVVAAYERLRDAYYAGGQMDVSDIEARLAFAEHAVSRGLPGSRPVLDALISSRVQLLHESCQRSDEASTTDANELIDAAAERLRRSPDQSLGEDTEVDALRAGDPSVFLRRVAAPTKQRDADPFLESQSRMWMLSPVIMLIVAIVGGCWLLLTYWPSADAAQGAQPWISGPVRGEAFEASERGFRTIRVRDRGLWVMHAPVTEREYDRLMPRSVEEAGGQTPAMVTYGEALEWCRLHVALLKEKYAGGLAPNGVWAGVKGRPLLEEEWLALEQGAADHEWVSQGVGGTPLFCESGLLMPAGTFDRAAFRVVLEHPDSDEMR